MAKKQLRWETREHQGDPLKQGRDITGQYLMAECECGHDSTLVAYVEGQVHMRAPAICQECGAELDIAAYLKALDNIPPLDGEQPEPAEKEPPAEEQPEPAED